MLPVLVSIFLALAFLAGFGAGYRHGRRDRPLPRNARVRAMRHRIGEVRAAVQQIDSALSVHSTTSHRSE